MVLLFVDAGQHLTELRPNHLVQLLLLSVVQGVLGAESFDHLEVVVALVNHDTSHRIFAEVHVKEKNRFALFGWT